MNPAIGDVPDVGIDVRVERGVQFPGRVWLAERPRGLIGVVHGVGEHSGRYAALASELVKARFSVVSLDLPGHGEAPGSRGDFPSWEKVRDQLLPAMFTALRGMPGQPSELPHVILGHSMGGLLALDYTLAHPKTLAAAVISAPAIKTSMPPWWQLTLANIARATAPSSGFPNGLDVSGISRIQEVVRHYQSDPRVHDRISPRLYFAFAEAQQRVMREARRLAVPTMLMQGMADRLVDPRGSLEFAGSAPHGMVRLVTLKETYHEIFNDLGRETVIRDVIAWLDAAMVV